jgi:hypothetical protein
VQTQLTIIMKACQNLQQDPVIASQMAEACRAVQNAMTATVMNRQQTTPPEQNPPL